MIAIPESLSELKPFEKVINSFAHKYSRPPLIDFEDLWNIGLIAAHKALQDFDESKVTNNRTKSVAAYVIRCIRSQMLLEIANNAPLLNIGSYFYRKDKDHANALINNYLHITPDENRDECGVVESIGTISESAVPSGQLGPEELAQQNDTNNKLYDAINNKLLSDKEREVITRRFFNGDSCADIAKDKNVTRIYINALCKRALTKLKILLGDIDEFANLGEV